MPTTETTTRRALLEMRGIHKSFGCVHALNGVDFTLLAREVHALVGENGAGKSTLMHILAGVFQPDCGTLWLDGSAGVPIADEQAARRLGIGIVYQERSLFDLLTVAENIFVSDPPVNRWGRLDRRRMRSEAVEVLAQLGLAVDPDTPLNCLAPAQQQMVEVAKAISVHARILIFDEPTAALSQAETAVLFDIIRKLAAQGIGIIYISHRLDEVFQIADRVTVLRDGDLVDVLRVADTSSSELISRMVGRDLPTQSAARGIAETAMPALEVRNLCGAGFRDVSFSVHPGEIVVMAGLSGAGRTETALGIFGVSPVTSGQILLDGKAVQVRSPRDAIAVGIGYVPEDRRQDGLFMDMTVSENIAAANLERFGSWWTRDGECDSIARQFVARLRITVSTIAQPASNLSGGNQQKTMLSRWFLRETRVLIVDEPTRGVDVAAKQEVHTALRELAAEGRGILVISSDLPEVLTIADRILVMRQGRIVADLKGSQASEETIAQYASAGTL
jgi:ABC-type sugar transport system ATPase subunit